MHFYSSQSCKSHLYLSALQICQDHGERGGGGNILLSISSLTVTISLPFGVQSMSPVHGTNNVICPRGQRIRSPNTPKHRLAYHTKVMVRMPRIYIESSKNLGSQNPYLAILKLRYFHLGDISNRLAVINVKLPLCVDRNRENIGIFRLGMLL